MPGFNITMRGSRARQGSGLDSNLAETARKHRFEIKIYPPEKVRKDAGIDFDAINFNAKTVNLPKLEYDEIQKHSGQKVAFYPGKLVQSTIDIAFYDVISVENGVSIPKLSRALMNLMPSTYFSGFSGYYRHANKLNNYEDSFFKMNIHKLDGLGSALQKHVFYDCWIKSFDGGDFGYAESDISEIKMTVRFNQFEVFQSDSGGDA